MRTRSIRGVAPGPIQLLPFRVFPTTTETATSNSSFPLLLDWATLWRWWRGVKVWDYSLSTTYTVSGGPPISVTDTASLIRFGNGASLPVATEKDLLRPGIGAPEISAVCPTLWRGVTSPGDVEAFITLCQNYSLSPDEPGRPLTRDFWRTDLNQHIPRLELTTAAFGVNSFGYTSGGATVWAFTANFDGIPLDYIINTSSDVVMLGADLTVNVSPGQYFEYGFGAAAVHPVRDAFTDALIRPSYQVPL